jgi:uncharacterized protein (DUF169 family)
LDNPANNLKVSQNLHEMLLLRYEPVAIKLIKNEAEIPSGAIRPIRDLKKHLALCQAFAYARREKKTVYMEKQDHWCWNPLIGLGHVDCSEGSDPFELICDGLLGIEDREASRNFFKKFPRLAMDTYIGIMTAPLCEAEFAPDIVLIYSNNAQLRMMLWAAKRATGKLVETQLDAIDSCVFSIVPPLLNGEYRVTLPDVGEYERAMTEEDEIIFSVPGARLDELVCGLRSFFDRGISYKHHRKQMLLDYPLPDFYKKLFTMWGLDA